MSTMFCYKQMFLPFNWSTKCLSQLTWKISISTGNRLKSSSSLAPSKGLSLNKRSGESADAVPHYHKLCNRDFHIWEIRRGQHSRSAMAEPRPGWTAFLFTVSPLPGKYELYTLVESHWFQDNGVWLEVTTSTSDNITSYRPGFNDIYEYSWGQSGGKAMHFVLLYYITVWLFSHHATR